MNAVIVCNFCSILLNLYIHSERKMMSKSSNVPWSIGDVMALSCGSYNDNTNSLIIFDVAVVIVHIPKCFLNIDNTDTWATFECL